ncbi:MAG: FecR domain-containing protein [Opitutaceae bacterium]|nr:FecR domain-containing protein [Opitutaceae bacterium]
MKISALRLLFCAFVAIALSLNSWAQTQLGRIKAAKVENDVYKVSADGSRVKLQDGAELTQSDSVTTGAGASVVLVFENGSSVKLGAESSLKVEEFLIDPLEADYNPASAKNEPTKSKTALNLSYGEMVGDVKKLNTASSYSIKTPVGAAGIRGTIYRIVFRPASDGKAFFTISTAEGLVVMEGVTSQDIPVAEGKEVVVEIDVPDTPGAPVAEPVVITRDISPEVKAAIQVATTVIVESLQQTTFTPPTTSPPPAPPPPPPPPPDPDLTPTTGK